MGGRGSSSGLSRLGPTQNQPAQPQQVQPQADSMGFSDHDDSDFHDLFNGRQYYQQQGFNDPSMVDTAVALVDYLHDQPTAGSMYSPSQQLNFAMKTGAPLTANQQFMRDAIMDGMHNIGHNVNLTRYARVDFMQNLSSIAGTNLGNFSNMSISQIQKTLVGKSFSEGGFISTSYNNFKTAPNGGAPFTDKAVKINYKAPANTQALMPGNGPGGALGEMVLAPDQNYKITGVRFTGNKGRSGSSYYNQIELDITIG